MHEILTVSEMRAAERTAQDAGVASFVLMQRAGNAIMDCAEAMLGRYGAGPITVLCGPGNNGGDGFVAAAGLLGRGHRVDVAMLGEPSALKGDAARAAALWPGRIAAIDSTGAVQAQLIHSPPALIVDALFGLGLTRPLHGAVADLITNLPPVPVLSVDVPSGVDADTGAVLGCAIRASKTLTFARMKPGHLLLPGRDYCGPIQIADIGVRPIPTPLHAMRNGPWAWRHALPRAEAGNHKYSRGWTAVIAGPGWATGAARLAAEAALRSGAGVVTVHAAPQAAEIIAHHVTSIIVRPFVSPTALARGLADPRLGSIVFGPAVGLGMRGALLMECVLGNPVALVLDADALSLLARHRMPFLETLRQRQAATVLTPHAGEFARLFGAMPAIAAATGRLAQARAAAKMANAVVVLKGADTVIAHPDGRAAINDNAPATLATMGSGDVLAGITGSLLAQGMPAFEAAAAAVWLHAAAAREAGPGLTADELSSFVPLAMAACSTGQEILSR